MTKSKTSIIFSLLFFILFASMALASVGYNPLAKYFPLFLSLLGAIFALFSMINDIKESKSNKNQNEENSQDEEIWDIPITHDFKVAAKNFLWVVFYFLLIMVVGFIPATIVFLVVFLKIRTDFNWLKIILATGVTVGLLFLLANIMYIKWPMGLFEIM